MFQDDLVSLFEREAHRLAQILLDNPRIRLLCVDSPSSPPVSSEERADAAVARAAYRDLLVMTAAYVEHTVPALRAASGHLAKTGRHLDAVWSTRIGEYATEETDRTSASWHGHAVWAISDLGGGSLPLNRAAPAALLYGRYFVSEVARHPYAILGAKGVLENLSLLVSAAIVQGVRKWGLADVGVTFFERHADLDIAHVKSGDETIRMLSDFSEESRQVVDGAIVTSGLYRAMVVAALGSGSIGAGPIGP